ncbi:hypothetical protein AXF42_Ash015352 [Apostasia shenzhenica]|uniref:Protein OS9-like domain-containing protein n=1 Tax=Apostasia shenzhenica TaxID=1088818 RepID=A0A2I0AM05_9ASPA|nr:hypothetical protein AXF42_Ash015352 [Apostasia shenzhenica]
MVQLRSDRLLSLKRASSFSSILICLYLLSSVSADEIFATAPAGVAFGRSSREPKYKIEYYPVESPFHPDNEQESLVMTNKDGQHYICFLPIVEETRPLKPIVQTNSTSIVLETDRRIKSKTPDELIEVIKVKCLYRHEGWWSYEFCHQKHVRQLHLEDDKAIQEFVMGVFDPEATAEFNQKQSDASLLKDPRSKDAAQRMFQQEKPMWHTIHCNEMPDGASWENHPGGTQITVIADHSDHYAT